jgi:hypothetical protein
MPNFEHPIDSLHFCKERTVCPRKPTPPSQHENEDAIQLNNGVLNRAKSIFRGNRFTYLQKKSSFRYA